MGLRIINGIAKKRLARPNRAYDETEFESFQNTTSLVLKVLKLYNLRTFKTSLVTINHEMHKYVYVVHTFFGL